MADPTDLDLLLSDNEAIPNHPGPESAPDVGDEWNGEPWPGFPPQANFPTQHYPSHYAAAMTLKDYCLQTGFNLCIFRTLKDKAGNATNKVFYICNRSTRNKRKSVATKNKTYTSKTADCPFEVIIQCLAANYSSWTICLVNNFHHNHGPSSGPIKCKGPR